jgi:hypothetical protein
VRYCALRTAFLPCSVFSHTFRCSLLFHATSVLPNKKRAEAEVARRRECDPLRRGDCTATR